MPKVPKQEVKQKRVEKNASTASVDLTDSDGLNEYFTYFEDEEIVWGLQCKSDIFWPAHRIKPDTLNARVGLQSLDYYYSTRLLRWAGHVSRMPWHRTPHKGCSQAGSDTRDPWEPQA